MTASRRKYVVITAHAWLNTDGCGIDHDSDLVEFSSVPSAARHGLRLHGHDDFNIGVLEGRRLVDVTWMGEPLEGIEDDMDDHRASVARIAEELGYLP